MAKISVKNISSAIFKEASSASEKELSKTLKNIVSFLHRKKLLRQSDKLLEEIEKIIDTHDERVRVKVYSAVKLPEHRKKDIENNIKEKYKAKRVESTYIEDKGLLGGEKIVVDDSVWDNTHRNKLNQLEKILIRK